MEEPIEREEVPETKEPIKSEPAAGATQGDRAGAGSPTPECSICLGHLINTSFTDSCLHQFCFTCLLQWSKIKTECPLCKQTFKSIIHNVRSEEDYDQYHVPRELVQPPPVSPLGHINLELDFEFIRHIGEPVARRFAYRTTMTPNRRFRLLPNPAQAQAQTLADMVPTVSREELRYRRRNPSDFRRNVYRHGEWSAPLPGVYARALERSAEFFRSNPYELNRLIPWINRDLQILLNGNEAHIAYVLRTIMDSLTRHDLRSAELRDVLRPYFGIHTDHFLHELMNYARTGFDMAAYDSFITYPTHGLPSGYLNNVQSPAASSSSSSLLSDDSDVRVVNHVGLPGDLPAVGPHALDMPGPSTVSQAFQIRFPRLSPTILTISSNSSESECEVVGYVKPRHERTPEIIMIESSDGEVAGPSTSSNTVSAPPEPSPLRSPSFTPPPLDEPSTSQESTRRNPRGARRKATLCFANLNCIFSDSSESDVENSDWSKKVHRRRPKKTSKTCRKSPRKSSQRKEGQGTKKRSRKTSTSNDNDSHHDTKKRKGARRIPKSRARVSNSSTEDQDDEPRQDGLIIKIRRDLMNQNDRDTEDSSSSSWTSSSSSSSSSESDSSDSTSDSNLPLKKRRSGRSRRRSENQCEKSKRSKGKLKSTVVKCQSVDATILKKDANKKEWYIDKSSNSRSRSRSNDDTERNDTRLRISLSEYRERRAAEQSSTTESAVNDDEVKRSSSQCSSRSERIQMDKYKSRHKGKHRKDTEQASTSIEKHSDGKSPKKRRKSHKKHKSSKAKHSKGKTKRDKRHYSSSSSLSSI